MKVQIAEARLRGDIETRGSSFRRVYLRQATLPIPDAYNRSSREQLLWRSVSWIFLGVVSPLEWVVFPKFYRLQQHFRLAM